MRTRTFNKPGAIDAGNERKLEWRHEQDTASAKARGLKFMDTQRRGKSSAPRVRRGAFLMILFSLLTVAGILAGSAALRAQNKAPAEQAKTEATKQETFVTPEEAMAALVKAVTTKDHAAFPKIFGAEYDQLLSGDPVEDENDLTQFGAAIQENSKLEKKSDAEYTFVVGKDNWPTPIPIVKRENAWIFDTKAGLEEILNRRIGENELSAIATCRTYALAQWEYFTTGDHDNDGVAEYAQRLVSSAGQRNGLYWETAEGEKTSPLGKFIADARAEGYGPKARAERDKAGAASAEKGSQAAGSTAEKGTHQPRHPFHGYYLRILTRQGPHAPGGKYDYIINGNMIGGYALVVFPAKWGNSGVMTFIVNQQGRVYEKNLGPDSEKIARSMAEYDPDASWKLVEN
jgi:DUF2950 family protein